jgi:hypothetical protein
MIKGGENFADLSNGLIKYLALLVCAPTDQAAVVTDVSEVTFGLLI